MDLGSCDDCNDWHPCQHDLDAMRGIRLPPDSASCCLPAVVYGIRHHEAFARSAAVEKLCTASGGHSSTLAFARARNARLIMSNEIPDMASDDVKPYCIWYPEVAAEETYRQLARKYPDLVYTVGRACAVAGYNRLYAELDILPEVSIAEEARDNAPANTGSRVIFERIASQPLCYAVLDDYTRTVNKTPRSPAYMNGDTAVRSLLDVRVGVDQFKEWGSGTGHNFDIVEDNYIAETSSALSHAAFQTLAREHEHLLYTPLPLHLPTIAKDALILMAAYEGNLDRYVRLRRPKMLDEEEQAVIRGIYHNTTFARYFSVPDLSVRDDYALASYGSEIRRAVIARFIMVNDLSHITPAEPGPDEMPGMIWWPLLPREETLRELVRRRPDMRLQAAMSCIEANYEQLWDELQPEPRWELWKLARRQHNMWAQQPVRSYYTEYLERREAELEAAKAAAEAEPPEPETLLAAVEARLLRRQPPPSYYPSETRGHGLCEEAAVVDKEPTTTYLLPYIAPFGSGPVQRKSVYAAGRQTELSDWELYICSSDGMRQKAREQDGLDVFNVDDYPWSMYPRHYMAESARKYEERIRREAGGVPEGEAVDVNAI